MQTSNLQQIINVLDARGYGPVPDGLDTAYMLAVWLVESGILAKTVLPALNDNLTVAELWKLLDNYGILDEEGEGGAARIRFPTLALERWRLAYSVSTAPFANAERTEQMLLGLQKLTQDRRLRVRFSHFSGLVRTLRGDLLPGQRATSAGAMLELSQSFLNQYSLGLFGDEKVYAEPDGQGVIGNVARWQQFTARGLPVYGGKILFGFANDGHLTMLVNSWLPVITDQENRGQFQVDWRKAAAIAYNFIKSTYQPDAALFTLRSENSRAGQTLYPYLPAAAFQQTASSIVQGDYRPAWAIVVADKAGLYSWEVMVDGETGEILNPTFNQIHAGINLPLCVYANNREALNGQPSPNSVDVDNLNLGSVVDFPLSDSAFQQPVPCGDSNFSELTLGSGNVYYHLRQARIALQAALQTGWSGVVGARITAPGTPPLSLPVKLRNSLAIVGVYNRTPSPQLTFDLGQFNVPTGTTIVENPMLDCEVIYHEYAHALFDQVQPDLFMGATPNPFREAINEGTAFYFGASLGVGFDPASVVPGLPIRWGKYAYQGNLWDNWRDLQRSDSTQQRANHDFFTTYGIFPEYDSADLDPAKSKVFYLCGLAWSRLLWDMRSLLGAPIADAMILRALNICGGIQSELETPTEALIHYDSEHRVGSTSHENALRLLAANRGVMADAPIHELKLLEYNGQRYLLATTEGGAASGGGCRVSADQGATWGGLGVGGLGDIQTLALLPQAGLLFAAGENWNTASGKPANAIYWYPLTDDPLDITQLWNSLPTQIPGNPNIFTLVASVAPTGDLWLFAGTEAGLYIYQSAAVNQPGVWVNFLSSNRIHAQSFQGGPQPQLYVVGNWDFAGFTYDSVQQQWSQRGDVFAPFVHGLTIVPDPQNAGLFWVGTVAGELYQFTPPAGWMIKTNLGKPIFSLWLDNSGVVYAGTNDGVIEYRNGVATSLTVVNPSGESPAHTTVVAALGDGSQLWFGTAQRGLWRYSASNWFRQIAGFPRAGQLVDFVAPINQYPQQHSFLNNQGLPPGNSATYLFYVSDALAQKLQFTVVTGAATLQLFYITPQVDLNAGQWAGLQLRTLNGNQIMQATIEPGYYILQVIALTPDAHQVTLDLT